MIIFVSILGAVFRLVQKDAPFVRVDIDLRVGVAPERSSVLDALTAVVIRLSESEILAPVSLLAL